ncbi:MULTISPECIES: cytochrome P450 [unclassified Mycolicibacterium]|jgi:cytochrome P450|uniref:cytochrome P450 n=1 Tax=unclassified Mycolicibacterium TaxID=2636767 RepID=UPI001F4BF602|nr:cytochrome P450 [Mycolicibacterium sp. YH-1]UNB52158.1 cytochrome P450 [Mycolicibacterium sp. YH-1]
MPVTKIEDLADETFDPHIADKAVFGDHPNPYPRLKEMRAEGPVLHTDFWEEFGIPRWPAPWADRWSVLSFDAVSQVLNDPITFSNKAFDSTLGLSFGQTVSVMDPPEHSPFKKLLQKAFNPVVIQEWGSRIVSPVVDELVTPLRASGKAELVEDFARPYPFNVIYRMLDLPPDDIETFYKLTVAQIIHHPTMDNAIEAAGKLGRYFRNMIDERKANPGNDVVSLLATVELDGAPLPDEVVISFLRQLINAGGDTTFRTTTALLTGLLTNPEQLDAVRADRSLIPAAVEEALRWDGPVLCSVRLTMADTEIAGVAVPEGAFLNMVYGSANHDETVFDHPEKFDIFRPKHRHFGFAHGAHNCLGQTLARLEMTRALNAMLDDLPNVRLDPDYPAPSLKGAAMRIPDEIRVVCE